MSKAATKVYVALTTIIIILSSLLAVSLMGGFSPSQPPEPELQTVRVGYLTGDIHQLSYFVAKNQSVGSGTSFFEKYKLNVTDAAEGGYSSGGTEMDAFAAGQVDIGFVGASPAITKRLNSLADTLVIAQANEIGSALVVAPNISSFTDLIGKTVAAPSRSSIQYFLLRSLAEQENVSIGDINVVEMGVGNMKLALSSGQISAFIAWEPFPSDAVLSGVGKILFTSNEILPDHLCCVVVVNREFALANPETVINFLRAHIEATKWINQTMNKPDSQEYQLLINISTQFTGRNATIVETAFRNMIYKFDIDQTFRDSFTSYSDKLIQFGIVNPSKIQAAGYKDLNDFVNRYLEDGYLRIAKLEENLG